MTIINSTSNIAATFSAISVRTLGGPLGGSVGGLLSGAGNMHQLSQILGQLSKLFQGAQTPGQNFQANPQPFSAASIQINIISNPLQTLSQPAAAQTRFPKAPGVNTEADWPAFHSAVSSRITGSDSAKNAIGMQGNIWTNGSGNLAEKAAIGWAFQQNDQLRYDADRKQFYVTNPDGSTRDVASMQDMVNVINKNGGANQNNGAAMQALGGYIDGLLKGQPSSSAVQPAPAQSDSGPGPWQKLVETLNQLIKLLGGGQPGAAGAAGGAAGAGSSAGAGASSLAPSAGPAGAGSGAGALESTFDSMVSSVGSGIDSMMSQAEQLLKSDKQSDQLKGQMLMQRAMRLFEMISKLMEQRSQMAAKAIQAIK